MGKPVVCDDGNPCTAESCEPAVGCVSWYTDAPCDDANGCTANDTCQQGQCVGSALEDCVCTSDADCAEFEDGDACNGTLICSGAKCAVDPGSVVTCPEPLDPQCGASQCQPATGACSHTAAADGKVCDDGDACTVGDACEAGACVAGPPLPPCDDGIPCTSDACDPGFGCVYLPEDGLACDDGDDCTLGDACGGGDCLPGAEVVCQDQCAPEWTLSCGGEDTWSTAFGNATDVIDGWPGCAPGALEGPEYAYLFTAPYDGEVTVTLVQEDAFTEVLLVSQALGGCEAEACVAWDWTTASTSMIAGEKLYVGVDSAGAGGGFTIELSCTPSAETDCGDGVDEDEDGATDCDDDDCAGAPACVSQGCPAAATIACGGVDSSATWAAGATTRFDAYDGCADPYEYPAPEYIYAFTAAADGSVFVTLTDESAETDLVILADSSGDCLPDGCLAWGLDAASFVAQAGETYYVVVDGYLTDQGSFTVSVACGDQPACVPDPTEYGALVCPEDWDTWNNAAEGSTDLVDHYGCNDFDYSGPEFVYTHHAVEDGTVTVELTEDSADLDLLLLADSGAGCDPAACLDWSADSLTFDTVAGATYYVVVDGFQGAVSDYDLFFTCGE